MATMAIGQEMERMHTRRATGGRAASRANLAERNRELYELQRPRRRGPTPEMFFSKHIDNTRIVKLGDQNPADSTAQNAPHAPPTLRNPGEKLPGDDDKDKPVMAPVQFPKDQTQTADGKTNNPSGSNPQAGSAPSSGQAKSGQTGSTQPSSTAPTDSSAPAPIHPTMPSPDDLMGSPTV